VSRAYYDDVELFGEVHIENLIVLGWVLRYAQDFGARLKRRANSSTSQPGVSRAYYHDVELFGEALHEQNAS
jgi:hypothetical protein